MVEVLPPISCGVPLDVLILILGCSVVNVDIRYLFPVSKILGDGKVGDLLFVVAIYPRFALIGRIDWEDTSFGKKDSFSVVIGCKYFCE